jgi:hypothetical protein
MPCPPEVHPLFHVALCTMHHPPEPHYSFTIPSLHDDTELSCRIHHPELLSSGSPGTIWRRRGIVMAHPYAPMGGSYHDRVVGIVVEEFLSLGYIIGTFNFRSDTDSLHRLCVPALTLSEEPMARKGALAGLESLNWTTTSPSPVSSHATYLHCDRFLRMT